MVIARCIVTCLVDGKFHQEGKEYQFPDGWREPESKIGRKKFEIISGGKAAAQAAAPEAKPDAGKAPLFDKDKGR